MDRSREIELKILVVDPIVKSDISEPIHKTYAQIKTSDVELGFEALREGPSVIETEEHERAAIPDLLRVIKEAEQQGYEAVIIHCFGNPGLEEAKTWVNASRRSPPLTLPKQPLKQE